jgi:transposase
LSSPAICSASRSTGTADAICQRASDALAGPHLHLHDSVLEAPAVHVDETGWRTRGEGCALWTATTRDAVFLQIAAHCNRERFDALIGTTYSGIVVSDRWNGYSHLDPNQRQVCWSHLQRDFRRHADGLGGQKTFGEQGLELTGRVFAAWRRITPPSGPSGHPSSTGKSRSAPKARTASGSPNAPSQPPPPAGSNTARYSPTSAT